MPIELLTNLAVAIPAAVAVIVVVVLFLKFLRDERKSRDAAQTKFLDTLAKLSVPITELTLEVRSLREAHDRTL
jgi:hypothetical protein